MAATDTIKQERMHIRLDALSSRSWNVRPTMHIRACQEFVLGQALHAADEVIHGTRPSR